MDDVVQEARCIEAEKAARTRAENAAIRARVAEAVTMEIIDDAVNAETQAIAKDECRCVIIC